jgi:hypothetical protein
LRRAEIQIQSVQNCTDGSTEQMIYQTTYVHIFGNWCWLG